MENKKYIDVGEGTLRVRYNELFEKQIRGYFKLSDNEKIEDGHIRTYIADALRSGILNMENPNTDD